jgi:phosphatidylserine decarboxylase
VCSLTHSPRQIWIKGKGFTLEVYCLVQRCTTTDRVNADAHAVGRHGSQVRRRLDRRRASRSAGKRVRGASACVAVLTCAHTRQDYHRFHSPVTGKVGELKMINGAFYTVNPSCAIACACVCCADRVRVIAVAIRTDLPVFAENSRCWTQLSTQEFGDVLLVAVGATLVGCVGAVERAHA